MKMCKDCRWCRRHWLFGYKFARCAHANNMKLDSVTGKIKPEYTFASTVRIGNADDYCGEKGNWFEPKKRKWRAW